MILLCLFNTKKTPYPRESINDSAGDLVIASGLGTLDILLQRKGDFKGERIKTI